jgi:F-type H+-transporting ATPase subunit a
MRFIFTTLTFILIALGSASAAGDGGHHALPMAAPVVFDLGWFKITNSMVAMCIVASIVILIAQLATRKITLIPSRLQNFVEFVVESLEGFLAGIMGKRLANKTFWFFGSVFIFIITMNWMGLFPFVGTLGWTTVDAQGHSGWLPLIRGANADLNMTLGLACIFFVLWIYWSIQANGVGGFLGHIFLYHGEDKGIMKMLLLVIFFLVGILEVISIMIRPISLTFRLFGNVYAGESLLEMMVHMGGFFGWLTALPFFFLELMVGAIQALVFTLLTAVFTALMCRHDDEEEHAH